MQDQIMNLKDVTSSILENMFFLYEETEPDSYNRVYRYCAFINEPTLKIKLLTGEELARALAKNFLGNDEIEEADILDVLKEILNMIIGNYIGKYCIEFKKHIPVPQSIKLPDNYTLDSVEHQILFYDSQPLCLTLESEGS